MEALKLDLQEFYKKAAVKPGSPHAFLMTDGQIADERFLVYINDMLSSGNQRGINYQGALHTKQRRITFWVLRWENERSLAFLRQRPRKAIPRCLVMSWYVQ